jgi:hypothetical protein
VNFCQLCCSEDHQPAGIRSRISIKGPPFSKRILQLNESPVLLLIRHPSKPLLQEPNPRCSVAHSPPSSLSSPPLPVPLVFTTPTTLSPVPALTDSVPPPPISATPALFNAAIQSNPSVISQRFSVSHIF